MQTTSGLGALRRFLPALALAALTACGPARTPPARPTVLPAGGHPSGERTPGVLVEVPRGSLKVDDGDTVLIEWARGDSETVRILGIDTPEIAHPQHEIPYDQPFGRQARAFAMGAFSAAGRVELLRAAKPDPYGRTLGYFYVDGKNYSELILRAGLAVETVSRYGDNGFPEEAAAVLAVARSLPPPPFENPGEFRRRMRAISRFTPPRP